MPKQELQRAFALEVVKKIRDAGYIAYWAGGCVRDQLIGAVPKDYDVATDASPEQVRNVFGKRRTLAIGEAFGVVAILGGRERGDVEVATFRQDATYSDGRHPDSVKFSSPEEDAQRRDFTINGMFYDPIEEKVIDFVGGEKDILAKRVRAIGDAELRFTEDKLRMIRAVRFSAGLGYSIEEKTFEAVRHHAAEITTVSGERIGSEIKRMLLHPSRADAMRLLKEMQLLPHVLPEVLEVTQAPNIQLADSEPWKETKRILALLETPTFSTALAATLVIGIKQKDHQKKSRSIIKALGKRLRYPNKEIDRTVWLAENLPIGQEATTLPWPKVQRMLVHEGAAELLSLLKVIHGPAYKDLLFCEQKLALPEHEWNPPLILTGDDLVALGHSPGKQFAEILEQVRDAQLLGKISKREEAIQLVNKIISSS